MNADEDLSSVSELEFFAIFAYPDRNIHMDVGERNHHALIISVDVGSSFIKCVIYDDTFSIKAKSSAKLDTYVLDGGGCEIEPDHLWQQFVTCIRDAIGATHCNLYDRLAMGFCTQRNTFITWNKETGAPFHNFISWKDVRSSQICREWNHSLRIKMLNTLSRVMYTFSRKRRFVAGSIYQLKCGMGFTQGAEILPDNMSFHPQMIQNHENIGKTGIGDASVAPRLLWAIETNRELREAIEVDNVYFGGIETWLLWKLTKGKVLLSEISLASSMGMFDPFMLDWARIILGLISVPTKLLPPVCDTGHEFGYCCKDIFGCEIPIVAIAGDQQAGTFGCACFDRGSVKLTLGTGMFIDINTGKDAHASLHGIYPLVGWKINGDLTYLAESSAKDAGSALLWAQSIGLFDNVANTSAIAESVESNGGVYFVSAFSGLQAPINNDNACTMFAGLKPNTSKGHMVRAVLESIAFGVYQIYMVMLLELVDVPKTIKCTGGISKNEFVCQLISDITGIPLETMINEESTSLGVAFMAGLSMGIWSNKDELRRFVPEGRIYTPNSDRRNIILREFHKWQQAVTRSLDWYLTVAE